MKREFAVLAQRHRKVNGRYEQQWARRYVCLSNAMRRATELLVQDGQPGDVVEITSVTSGRVIGTIKVHVHGQLTAQWIYDCDHIESVVKEDNVLRLVS